MRKKQKEQYWLFGLIAAVLLFLYIQSKGGLRKAMITNRQIAEMYRELISSKIPMTIEVDGKNIPWQLDIASMTNDYIGVKAEYLNLYNRNMTDDLLQWFSPAELSEYVAELWKNGQVMTP